MSTTAATDSSKSETSAAVVASPAPSSNIDFPSAPPAAATPDLRQGAAGGAASCWDYVQRTGLLDVCAPENRDLIRAAYEDAYQTSGDATTDDRGAPSLASICKLADARLIAETSGHLLGRAA